LAALGAGGRSPGGPVGAPRPWAVLPLGLPGEGAEAPADETLGRAVGDGLAAWLRSKPVDCGNTSRRGILRYLHEGSWAGPANEGDAGNGALKRNLPSVLATLWHPAAFEPLSLLQARLTHHHPLSDAATVGVGDMARQLILGEAAQEVACWADDWVASYPVFRHVPYPGRASGYVVDTVQTVLHHFVAEPDFEAAVVATVNRGGDADTTGALVGLLAGARCGASGLPRPWLRRLPSATVAAITEQTGALLSLAAASAPRGAGPAPDAGGAWRWPPPAPGA
jgi:ADP-ribosyl-[dinitrogen reductase] hydrolase